MPDKINFLELAEELGGFGKFQKYIFFLGCISVFMTAMGVVNMIFLGNELDHRCLITECEHQNNATYVADFLNFTTPLDEKSDKLWNKCNRFKSIDTRDTSCDPLNFNPHLTKNCSTYVFDTSVLKSTTVTEFDLVCDNSWQQTLGSLAYMVGMLFGAFSLGNLADIIGRKKGLLVALLIFSIGGTLSAFSYNYYMFIAMRFIYGMGAVAIFAISFILIIEFSPVEYRNMCGILIEVPFALGEAFVAVFAYFFRDWRYLQIACSIPPIFLFSYFWIMPESIRWSVSQGRYGEAKETIKRIEKWNKVKVSKKFLDILDSKSSTDEAKANGKDAQIAKEKRSALDLFRYPNLRKRTLTLMFCWGAVTCGYYGLNLNSANLGGDLFINFVAIMLIEIPSYIFSYLILDRIGRKWSLSLTYFIGGMGCLVSGALPGSFKTTIIVLSMIGKFGAAAAFAIIYVYTAEIFPTSMRSLGLGTCSTAARIGGILAPFTTHLAKLFASLPLLVFGVLLMISAILVIFLPETFGRELPQTIEESESFGLDQSVLELPPCCASKKHVQVTPEVNVAFSENL